VVTLNRKNFQNIIIEPLNRDFQTTIYFNGKLARSKKLFLPRNACGASYLYRKQKPIVILWQRNWYDSLQTLFHEIGHVTLHGKGKNFKGGREIEEIEAESVAREACQLLKLPYNPYFKISKDTNFIDYYMEQKPEKLQPRHELIHECAIRIYKTLNTNPL
jgi:hypothetical protein